MGDLIKGWATEVLFSRRESIAGSIETLLAGTRNSIDAALYRLNNPRLVKALDQAFRRGVCVRVILDRSRFEECESTRGLLSKVVFPFRTAFGRDGEGSKMHHKFLLLDDSVVLTGSYNWSIASEGRNYENVLVLRQPRLAEIYQREFGELWAESEEIDQSEEAVSLHT